jgi:YesN/AraC family two-component response regulator
MYLSPVYISKIFKEETGESPINYLIKIRLEKAKDILLNSDSGSIKNIANQVGYDDVYHFSKLFKKYYGISPLYYKKRAMRKNAASE